MSTTISFDVQFKTDANTAVAADADIQCLVYDVDGILQATLTTATSPAITYDSTNKYYRITDLDVSAYPEGNITVKWYAKYNTIAMQPYPYQETISYPGTSGYGFSSYDTLVSKLQFKVEEDTDGARLTTARARTAIQLALSELQGRLVHQYDAISIQDDLLYPTTTDTKYEYLLLQVAKVICLTRPGFVAGFKDGDVEWRPQGLSNMLREDRAEVNEMVKMYRAMSVTDSAEIGER